MKLIGIIKAYTTPFFYFAETKSNDDIIKTLRSSHPFPNPYNNILGLYNSVSANCFSEIKKATNISWHPSYRKDHGKEKNFSKNWILTLEAFSAKVDD